MTSRELLASLRFHWGDKYEFKVTAGRYTAAARFGQREVLTAEDPEQLLTKVRRHYRPELLDERCST
jgi:hypothetical protein